MEKSCISQAFLKTAGGRMHIAYYPLYLPPAIKLRKPSKESGIFQSLAGPLRRRPGVALKVQIRFGFKNLKPSIRLMYMYTARGAFFSKLLIVFRLMVLFKMLL